MGMLEDALIVDLSITGSAYYGGGPGCMGIDNATDQYYLDQFLARLELQE